MVQYFIQESTNKNFKGTTGWSTIMVCDQEDDAMNWIKSHKNTKEKTYGYPCHVYKGNDNKRYRILPGGIIRVVDVIYQTMADGDGLRTSIYGAGCIHNCPGCHNPETHSQNAGKDIDIIELAYNICEDKYSDVTFSGGDPLLQYNEFTALARLIKFFSGKSIWCYTGWTWEVIINKFYKILPYIDIIVDGKFIKKLYDPELYFRGSSNQRIIDIKKTLKYNKIILHNYERN